MFLDTNFGSKYVFGVGSDAHHPFSANSEFGTPTSAGVKIEFITNSKNIKIYFDLVHKPVQAHTGAINTNGVAYIIKDLSGITIKKECIYTKENHAENTIVTENTKNISVSILFPCNNEILNIQIEIDDGSVVSNIEKQRKILLIGSSFLTGNGTTFPNGTFCNILSAKTNSHCVNISSPEEKFLDELHIKEITKTYDMIVCDFVFTKSTFKKISKFIENIKDKSIPTFIINRLNYPDTNATYLEIKNYTHQNRSKQLFELDPNELDRKTISLCNSNGTANDYLNYKLVEMLYKKYRRIFY